MVNAASTSRLSVKHIIGASLVMILCLFVSINYLNNFFEIKSVLISHLPELVQNTSTMHLANCTSGATIVPIHPKRILYNKVPKCGSTTLNKILTKAGKANGYHIVPQHVFRGSRLNSSAEATFIKQFSALPHDTLMHRHILLPDFKRYNSEYPSLMNMIREPLSQLVSNYYYIRQFRKFTHRMPKAVVKMTLDDCVAQNHSSCMGNSNIIPFFCGQDKDCMLRSPDSLAKAKRNVCQFYDTVGYMEDMRGFVEVVQHLYPRYFTGILNVYDKKVNHLHASTITHNKKEPSPQTVDILRHHLVYDIDFYKFIQQRFERQHADIMRKYNNIV